MQGSNRTRLTLLSRLEYWEEEVLLAESARSRGGTKELATMRLRGGAVPRMTGASVAACTALLSVRVGGSAVSGGHLAPTQLQPVARPSTHGATVPSDLQKSPPRKLIVWSNSWF
eukprot:COSAG03_NODE_2372_length_2831_cov_4.732796_2_plen_115_part_00